MTNAALPNKPDRVFVAFRGWRPVLETLESHSSRPYAVIHVRRRPDMEGCMDVHVDRAIVGVFGLSCLLVFCAECARGQGVVVISPGEAVSATSTNTADGDAAGADVTEASAPAVRHATVPVGGIVAWAKSLPGTTALPDGWVECDGRVLKMPGSPYDGAVIPDLNGASGPARFLRGGESSGATGGAAEHVHGAFLTERGDKRQVNVSARTPAGNLPPYYEVVWVMRVK